MKDCTIDFFRMYVRGEQTQEYYNNFLLKIMETKVVIL